MLLPILVIDASTIFLGSDLMPQRFPYFTVFSMLGVWLGYGFTHYSLRRKWLLGIVALLFLTLHFTVFNKEINKITHNKETVKMVFKS